MGVDWSIQPAPARPEGIYPRTPCGPVEQAATVRQRKSVPSPHVVADLTEHIGEELSVPHSSRIDSSVSILCILLRVLGGARPRLNRQTHLHFGVSGHGEAVQPVGDDSQAGGDQECCSIELSTL